MGGPTATLTPQVSVTGVRRVLAGVQLEHSGRFFYYDGTVIPW
jgi:hypothetical protein